MQLASRPNARLGSAQASRQAVKGRKTALSVPNAVKDVFMPALRWARAAGVEIHRCLHCWSGRLASDAEIGVNCLGVAPP